MKAHAALSVGDGETRSTLKVLEVVAKRLSSLPGQRAAVLISAGFITPFQNQEVSAVIDRAVRSGVVINCLDARGLYTPAEFDAGQSYSTPDSQRILSQYQRLEAMADGGVLGEIADGTGGTYLHDRNDFLGSLRQLTAPPDVTYVLTFSPSDLKTDGKYHKLKVTLKNASDVNLQARRGYFAPTRAEDAAEQAKDEIEDAVFSRDQVNDIPVSLHTQFFKTSDFNARLAVVAHVDLKPIRFRKLDGRNRNTLTVVTGIFDNDGNYITGQEKTIEMRFRDETLESRIASGLTVRANFDVKTGTYGVRMVARDTDGHMYSATQAVQIP